MKNVETRSWPAPEWLLGQTIAIHAGKRVVRRPGHRIEREMRDRVAPDWSRTIPAGAVMATATLAGMARALRTVMCSRESVHPADVRTTHQNVQVVRDGLSSEVSRAIVLWDKVGGGLGLSKAVADNLGRYTHALLEIAREPGQRSERERLLREDTAALLHRWAVTVAPHTLAPEQTPAITEYGGTTFRSQLEARWAAYFDRRDIAWEYEPVRFNGWTPDFRLALDGAHVYAEVKPVAEFPIDVAQRILNAGCDGDILILGQGPRHAWRYWSDGWKPVDLSG